MSGICGVINLDGAPVEPAVLEKMAQAAAHRGPDGIHYHTEGAVGLAHLALDITPESVRERQPLVSEREGLVLVADARIDNREELIGTLWSGSHLPEESPTDAEIILEAYRRWGEECPAHLIGDFAFAIWDGRRRRLFAARDAMAMRALYYRVEPRRRVLFGTEVKQILAADGVPARLFEPAVGAYLAGPFGSLEWSFYEGISQLAPAHALMVDKSGQRTWRYWDIDPDFRIEYSTEEEYVEHFLEVFLEAVRCRLRSTKPVGIFLSGGMDSGSIASVAGWLLRRDERLAGGDFRAYCWAFEELSESDERHISDGIVSHYGIPERDVAADDAWPLKDYPAHGPDRDEPLIGVYQVLIEHTLAAANSDGAGYVFSGDRGDLMVGDVVFDHLGLLRAGQLPALWEQLGAHARRSKVSLGRVVLSQLLKPLLLETWPWGAEQALALRRRLLRLEPPPYPPWVRPEFAERIGLAEIIKEAQHMPAIKDRARRMRYELIFTPMHLRGMVWSERSWARYGLGFADPWSDRRLAEFALAVPQWRIQRVGEFKRVARLAMRGIMPEQVRRSTAKISPAPLYHRALKEQARGTVLELLTGSRAAARGYTDEGMLRDYYKRFVRGGGEIPEFWWALTLEMWLRQHRFDDGRV
jgi:asparagine synthase (glutamine-hydrolysing)